MVRLFKTSIVIALVGAIPVLAQAPLRVAPADPALDALVAEALAKTPEMASARAAVEAAQRRITPAATLPDPFLSSTYQNDGRSLSLGRAEGSFLGLMASQTIPWPGKLSLAGKVAESAAREIERGTVGRASLTIESRLRNAWYDLALAQTVDRILDDRKTAAAQIEASVRDRYAAGLAVQQDVLRAQIELARIDELKVAQAATIANRGAEITRLLDRTVPVPVTLPEPAALPVATAVLAAVAARSPELAAAQQSIETGRFSVDLARRNFLPDLTFNAGSMYRGSFEMGPMWQVGVGISLPIWIERRQQNRLAEAQAIVAGRTADVETTRRELELRTRERIAQLEASTRVAQLYRDKIVPLDQISLESALASYQAGKIPFITVLDALNTLYGDRAAYAGRLAEGAKWRVAIDEASLQPTSIGGGVPAMGGGATSTTNTSGPAAQGSSGPMTSMR